MTEKEAVKIAQGLITDFKCESETMVDFCNVVIQALEQEPSGDMISRQKLLKAITTLDKFGCNADSKLVTYKDHYISYVRYYDVIDCIKSMWSIVPKPKTGHLIFTQTIFDKYGCTAECSSCHKKWKTYDEIAFKKEHDYCPNCGAKMIESQEEREEK